MNLRRASIIVAIAVGLLALPGCPVDLDLGARARAQADGAPTGDAESLADVRADAAPTDAKLPSDAGSDAPVYTGPRRMFVTSEAFSPDFSEPTDRHAAQPLARADAKCVEAATNARLGGDWKAWLYGDFAPGEKELAVDHANAKKGPYVLVDGKSVVFTGSVPGTQASRAPSMTELGTFIADTERTWIGDVGYRACERYLDGQFLSWGQATKNYAVAGRPTMPGRWADYFQVPCNQKAHLYCFEQ